MSKKASNALLIAAALSMLAAAFDARVGFVVSIATMIGFVVYFRREKGP